MSYRTRSRYRPYKRQGFIAKGNKRAADQQRDVAQVVVNANYAFSCGQTFVSITDNESDPYYDTSCMAINIYDILRNSEYYGQFSNMYDQVKIDNVKAKIIATNWISSTKDNNTATEKVNEYVRNKSYVIVTAWDRSGLSDNQIIKNPDWDDDEPKTHQFWTTIGKDIATYSSARTKHLGPGNAYEIVRQLYPESAYEKSQFISTKLLVPQQTRVNDNKFTYKCWYNIAEDGEIVQKSFDFDRKYPTNLLNAPQLSFKPTLLVNVISGPSPQKIEVNNKDSEGFETLEFIGINKIMPVTFDIEFDICVTFRGLRYSKIVTEVIPPKPIVPEFELMPSYPGDNIGDGPEVETEIFKITYSTTDDPDNEQSIDSPFGDDELVVPYISHEEDEKMVLVSLEMLSEANYVIFVQTITSNYQVEGDQALLGQTGYIIKKDKPCYMNMTFSKIDEEHMGEDVRYIEVYHASILLNEDKTYFPNIKLNFEFDEGEE